MIRCLDRAIMTTKLVNCNKKEKLSADDSERHFPGTSEDKRGHYVGISKNIAHAMTFIISDDTNKRIQRSVVQSAGYWFNFKSNNL